LSKAAKSLKLLGDLCLASAVACWFQYTSIQLSWAGKRPLSPNLVTGQTIPFQNHGIMYVSEVDLNRLHFFVTPGLMFAVIGVVLILLHKMTCMSEPQPTENPSLKRAGTVAECAFLLFLPIWLFANPYTALATTFGDPQRLLFAYIATGALMVGWWMLAAHGSIFKTVRSYGRSPQ
jgi:hypothetical protein